MPIPTVLELIHARLADKSSQPGHRNDPYKLAIAAEDGSMRWVVAAGLLSRLEAHGIYPDLIVGTSGGGLAASYYAAGAMRQGAMTVRYLNAKGFNRDGRSHKFINPWRLLNGRPVMDVHGAIHTVFTERVPLPWDALRRAPAPTWLTAVTREGELVLQPLHGQDKPAQQLSMVNTARIPFIAHNPRDASVMWDGGMVASIPVKEALELGATHVLIIRCKSGGDTITQLTKLSKIEKYLIHPRLRRHAPDLLGTLRQRGDYLTNAFNRIAQASGNIFTLALPRVDIGMAESDEGNLFRQLIKAYNYAGTALNLPDQPLPEEWQPDAAHYLQTSTSST